MATDYTSQITAYYQAIQFRAPPAAELATYNAALQSGSLTAAQVITGIENSSYTQTNVNAVIREYQAAFGRVPDQAGLAYWTGVVAANPSALANLNTIFSSSAEFTARYGATATTAANPALVNELYQNVLGRLPDAAGLAYWSSQNLNASQLLQAFAQSPEFINNTASFVVAFETAETTGLAPTTGSLFTVSGGNLPVTTTALTVGTDSLTGTSGNDLFVAGLGGTSGTSATLTAGDSITGNGGTDTLKLVGAANFTNIAAATISGISILDAQTVTLDLDASISLSSLSGLTTVIADTAATSLSITGISKGTTLEVKGTAGSAVTDTFGIAGSATDTINLITATAKVDQISLKNSDGTATAAQTTLAITGDSLSPATAASSTTMISDVNLTKVTITDSGATNVKFDATALLSVNASASTGAITLDATTAGVASGFTFTGGAGNDTLKIMETQLASLTAGSQLSGGTSGTDTLEFTTTISSTDAPKINATTGFDILKLDSASNLDASTITNGLTSHIALNNTGANTFSNLTDGTTIDFLTNTASNTFGAAVTASTLNLNIGTATSAGIDLTNAATSTETTTFGTINIASNGTAANTITFANLDNTKFVITGSDALNLKVATGTATGDTIDATAFTGKLTVTGSGFADIIKVGNGGSVVDGGAGADQITAGSGSDNFVYTTLGNSVASAADTITGFTAGSDQFKVTTVPLSVQQGAQFTATGTGTLATDVATAINAGTATFAANNAAVITITGASDAGTYLVINDGTAGYSAANDAVIHLVGLTGTISTTDFVNT